MGNFAEGVLLGSALVGSVGVYGEGEAGVSGDADLGGLGYASVGWGTDMGAWVVSWRACAARDGFQALHWKMLS